MTKNKKLLIILALVLVVILLVISLWLIKNKKTPSAINGLPTNNTQNLPAPKFLSDEEKINRGLAPEQKIQIIEQGKNEVYKVIKSDTDIVSDPAAVGSISPRQQSAIK